MDNEMIKKYSVEWYESELAKLEKSLETAEGVEAHNIVIYMNALKERLKELRERGKKRK